MAHRTELEITWDGPIEGLAEHRISLTHFGPALNQLMLAARRIASNAITNALEPAETGRLANAAKNLDIEIKGVISGSGGFSTVITFATPDSTQSNLFNSITENVGIELLESIQAEATGTQRNSSVRKYLEALPARLTRQSYNLHENGRQIRAVKIGEVRLPEAIEDLPFLTEMVGKVTGVGFEPGRSEIKIKGEGVAQMNANATEEQVDRALQLRPDPVRTVVVSNASGTKLLLIEKHDQSKQISRAASANDAIFRKWEKTFRELA